MRRSMTLKMSLVGAVLALGAFADDTTMKDMNKGKADATFVQDAFVIGQSEIKLSQLAVNQSTNPAVKELAQQMIDDHTKANDALKELAQRKDFMLPFDTSMGASEKSGSRDTKGSDKTGTGLSGSGSIGSSGATGTGSVGGTGSTGADRAGSGSAESDMMGTMGSTGSGTTGSGSTGSTASGSVGSTGSGSTGDTYGSAEGAIGTTGAAAHYGTQMSSDQKNAQKKYDELAKLSGEKFDRAYINQLSDDHKKAIKAFEKESKSGVDSELKTWASNTLPTLKHHFEMVQSVEKELKSRRGSM